MGKSKSKSRFDYMNFTGGSEDEFVVHAGKHTKQQALDLFMQENDCNEFGKNSKYRVPTLEDIKDKRVRYFINVPDGCGYDGDGGCYTYCGNDKGSFPVYVINYEDIRNK